MARNRLACVSLGVKRPTCPTGPERGGSGNCWSVRASTQTRRPSRQVPSSGEEVDAIRDVCAPDALGGFWLLTATLSAPRWDCLWLLAPGTGPGSGPRHHAVPRVWDWTLTPLAGELPPGRWAMPPSERADRRTGCSSSPGVPPALGEAQQVDLKAAVQEPPAESGVELANWNWRVVRQFVPARIVEASP